MKTRDIESFCPHPVSETQQALQLLEAIDRGASKSKFIFFFNADDNLVMDHGQCFPNLSATAVVLP